VAGPLQVYLIATRDKGLIFNPKDQSFDCHVDADFTGAWDKEEALEDPDTARSRSGFIISFVNCPIIWSSKLQTTIALSSTESEYVVLSLALRPRRYTPHGIGEGDGSIRIRLPACDCTQGPLSSFRRQQWSTRDGHSGQVPPKDEAHTCGIPSFQIVR
jgi:hypothetical protein